jgi:hypothetical protein
VKPCKLLEAIRSDEEKTATADDVSNERLATLESLGELEPQEWY